MGLADIAAADAAIIASQDGESVTYTDSGGSETFSAVVLRSEPDAETGSLRSRKRRATVLIPYSSDPTVGRTACTEQIGETILLPMVQGGAAVTAQVWRVTQTHPGFITCEVVA